MSPPIHLSGTTLEGGGQLLRLALTLSSLTGTPLTITNIRGNRRGGTGLKAQHLTSAQWLGRACNAHVSGAILKSKDLTFVPDTTTTLDMGDEVSITQNTPGAISLVLQAILPFLVFSVPSAAPVRITISGGTNVSNSPSYDYIAAVLLPMLERVGLPGMTVQLHARGWSQGSMSLGSMTVTLKPLGAALPAFNLTQRGEMLHVQAIVVAPRYTEREFRGEIERMFDVRWLRFFNAATTTKPEFEITFEPSHHEKRYYVLLVATTSTGIKLGRDWLYNRAVRPGQTEHIVPSMVEKVSDDLLSEIEHGGCVDEWMRDQLVVFQALAEGTSRVDGGGREPSLHARTAMWVASEVLGVEWDGGGCEGIGFVSGGKGVGIEEVKNGVGSIEIEIT
jgi:RNA 3'-terminal phosphate cyclase (ATP)